MNDRPRSIGFILHPREVCRPGAIDAAVALAEAEGFRTWAVVAEEAPHAVAERTANGDTELLVTVGGDGTFLLGARLAAPRGIPLLGCNRGQLGFLTDVDLADLPDAIACVAHGGHRLERRSLLEVQLPDGRPAELALNEVVVKSTGMNLVRIAVDVDDEPLGEFDADGVIIATSTGSTAYALSAGGPPVDPRVRALVVVPLAPHAVITRPVLLPEAVTVRVTVERGRSLVAADGRLEVPLRVGSVIAVRPGPDLRVVEVAGSSTFLRKLREKVRFGMPLKGTLEQAVQRGTIPRRALPPPGEEP